MFRGQTGRDPLCNVPAFFADRRLRELTKFEFLATGRGNRVCVDD